MRRYREGEKKEEEKKDTAHCLRNENEIVLFLLRIARRI